MDLAHNWNLIKKNYYRYGFCPQLKFDRQKLLQMKVQFKLIWIKNSIIINCIQINKSVDFLLIDYQLI